MTASNILNILRQTSINAVIATGMTFVILTGGIDLSVGSILGFSGAVAAMMLAEWSRFYYSNTCNFDSWISGWCFKWSAYILRKLQPFIVTLATMTMLRGATLVFY